MRPPSVSWHLYTAAYDNMSVSKIEYGAHWESEVPSNLYTNSASVALIFSIRLWQETVYGKEATEQTVRGGFEIEDTLYVVGPVTWVGAMPPFIAAAGIGTPLYLIYAIWEAAGYLRRNR